jgi:carboxylate-amine ligase
MLADIVAPYGFGILAAGTHPTAAWTEAQQTKAERYDAVMHDVPIEGLPPGADQRSRR